jgi:hypothetical protein
MNINSRKAEHAWPSWVNRIIRRLIPRNCTASNRTASNQTARGTTLPILLAATLLIAACSVTGRGAVDEAARVRTPQPTFTPTPLLSTQPQPGEQQSGGQQPPPQEETAPGASEADQALASVVVNSPLVNVRTGPGTTYDVVATVERGQEFNIFGRNADSSWWFVCCVQSDYVWIINELVDTDGPVDTVPITGGATEAIVTPEAPSAPVAAAPAQFDLIRQERFAETDLVRVFLYISGGNNTALAGYSARVSKDGRELPVTVESFGGQPAFTWPFQDTRQRHQNFKIEFEDISPAGNWEVELIDGDGNGVGPVARFNLTEDDPLRELYVRYERR